MPNNLLIAGMPHSGKTTLLESILPKENAKGFVTREIRYLGQREGFEIVRHDGFRNIFAHINFKTGAKVSKYNVDIKVLDEAIAPLFHFGEGDLLYIDEIGRMELLSDTFKDLVNVYLNCKNPFMGTICHPKNYDDDFTKMVRRKLEVEMLMLEYSNREETRSVAMNWLEQQAYAPKP